MNGYADGSPAARLADLEKGQTALGLHSRKHDRRITDLEAKIEQLENEFAEVLNGLLERLDALEGKS